MSTPNKIIIVVVIILIFVAARWSTKPPPTVTVVDCLKACEEEGWNRAEAWIKECNEACLKKYKTK